MKNLLILTSVFCFIISNAQNVGVNTKTPTATLDVNGNLRVRTVPVTDAAASYNFLVANAENEVERINGNFASAVNTTIAKGETTGAFTLLSVGINDWLNVNFSESNVIIDTGNNYTPGTLTTSSSYYTVPSTGIYEIDYSIRFGRGVELGVLTDKRIGIIRQTTSSTTILDSKSFDGIDVLVLTLSLTSSSINSVYQLNAGDKIYFAASSGITVNLLNRSRASFVIKKISN